MRTTENGKRGFTLIEMVVVVGILAVLLSFAVPSLVRWQRGAESVRLNQTARTIFLSAQEAFTNARGSSLFAELNAGGRAVDLETEVEPTPGAEELEKNAGNIRALRLDRGGGGDEALRRALAPYLGDAGVLGNAVLVEYNGTTGVVRAVFYSEQADALGYDGAPDGEENVVRRDGDSLRSKRQGYYGVDYTGELGGAMELAPPVVEIVNGERLTVEWTDVTPVANDETVTYDLRVFQNGAEVLTVPGLPNLYKLQIGSAAVAEDTPTDGSILYRDIARGKLVLVLDCLHHSVSRYAGIAPGLIRAEVTARAPGAKEETGVSNEEHSHFAGESAPGGIKIYELKNARHLNNMRRAQAGSSFRQTAPVIDWRAAEADYRSPNDLSFTPTRFADGEAFTGSYKAAPSDGSRNGVITGLTIDPAGEKQSAADPRDSFVGLFAMSDGAALENLILEDARVRGVGHVGAFVGRAVDTEMLDCHLRSRGEPLYDVGGGEEPPGGWTDGGRWQSGRAYRPGDVVLHGGTYYRCLRELPEELRNVPPQNKKAEGYWEKLDGWRPGASVRAASFSNVEEWRPDKTYGEGAVVTHEGRWYLVFDSAAGPGEVPGGEGTPWLPMSTPNPDGEWPDWVEGRRYVTGDQVTYQGRYWVCVAFSGSNYRPDWFVRPPQWADLGEAVQTPPPGPDEPPAIPPSVPEVSGGTVDFSGLSRVTGSGDYVGGLVGEGIGGRYQTVSAGGLVYAGKALSASVSPRFGSDGAGEGRLILDYTLSGGGSHAGGLFGALSGGRLTDAAGRALVAGGRYVGGIAGYAEKTALSGALRSVGDVSGGGDAGGFFGGCDFALSGLTNESSVGGNSRAGGLVGRNTLAISDCWNRGLVRGMEVVEGAGIERIGGVAGENAVGASIVRSGSAAVFWNPAAAPEMPGSWDGLPDGALLGRDVGGIAGRNAGEISGCTLAGNVFGRENVGGVAGCNTGDISNCAFAEFGADSGIVQGVDNVGGVVGRNSGSGRVSGTVNGTGRRPGFLLSPGDRVDISGLLKVLASGGNAGGYVGLEEAQTLEDLENGAFVSGNGNVGGIAGYARTDILRGVNRGLVQARGEGAGGVAGRSDALLDGCRNEGRVSGLGGRYHGGVAGVLEGGARLEGGVNAGLVENPEKGAGADDLGGVAGYVREGSLADCRNEGPVGSEYTGASAVGGVVGRLDSGSVTGSQNGLEEEAPGHEDQPRLWNAGTILGGIVGHAAPSGAAGAAVSECRNYADLTDTGNPGDTGGILGRGKGNVTVEDCRNEGDIESTGTAVGGIAGRTENTSVLLRGCTNAGDIRGGDAAGGIAGKNQAPIGDCVNEGREVTGGSYVGGVVGSHDSRKAVSGCESAADVTASGSAAGGIAGSSRGALENCVVRGGYVGAGKASGGASNAGGLVGSSGNMTDDDGTVIGCTIAPPDGKFTVRAPGNYVGGLVGQSNGLVEGNLVKAEKSVEVTGGSSVGGLVGYQQTGEVRQYENGAQFTVRGSGIRVGGIVGEARVDITGQSGRPIVNTAAVKGGSYNVGGIVGETNDRVGGGLSGEEKRLAIRFCENRGTVESAERNVGGILGGTHQSSAGVDLVECVNAPEGAVLLPNNGKNAQNSAGGIAGYAKGGVFSACVNEGAVRHEGASSAGSTGGIMGSGSNVRFEDCVNRGKVYSVPSGAGGILGTASGAGLIGCRSEGEVRSEDGIAGGIAGVLREDSLAAESENSGAVAGGRETGGIAGSLAGSILEEVTNSGPVTGGGRTGGLAGSLDEGSEIRWSGNTGSVSGKSGIGGLVGRLSGRLTGGLDDGTGDYRFNLNLGRVEGASARGGLVGERAEGSAITGSFYYAVPSDDVASVGEGDAYLEGDSPADGEPPADRRLTDAFFEGCGVSPPDYTDFGAVADALARLPWPLAAAEEDADAPPENGLPPAEESPAPIPGEPPASDGPIETEPSPPAEAPPQTPPAEPEESQPEAEAPPPTEQEKQAPSPQAAGTGPVGIFH